MYIFLTDVCCNEKLSQKMWGNPISRILALGQRQVKCKLILFCISMYFVKIENERDL